MEHRPAAAETAGAVSPLSLYADEMAVAAARFKAHGRNTTWALWIPGLLLKGALWLLVRLTLPSARRTEFQADAVAARVASTQAAVAALRDRQLAGIVDVEIHRLAIAARTFGRTGTVRTVDQDLWAKVSAHTASLPESARNKHNGVSSGYGSYTDSDPLGRQAKDSCLPAIELRVARLSIGTTYPATVMLDGAQADAIEAELCEPKRLLARKVVQDCVQA
jgi:hypothetical protein